MQYRLPSIILIVFFCLSCSQSLRTVKTNYGELVLDVPDSTSWAYIPGKSNCKQIIMKGIDLSKYPRESDFISCDNSAQMDSKALSEKVVYPSPARLAGIEEQVIVRVLIDTDGLPKVAKVQKGNSDLLIISTLQAVMSLNYIPAVREGKYIPSWVSVPVNYSLK